MKALVVYCWWQAGQVDFSCLRPLAYAHGWFGVWVNVNVHDTLLEGGPARSGRRPGCIESELEFQCSEDMECLNWIP